MCKSCSSHSMTVDPAPADGLCCHASQKEFCSKLLLSEDFITTGKATKTVSLLTAQQWLPAIFLLKYFFKAIQDCV